MPPNGFASSTSPVQLVLSSLDGERRKMILQKKRFALVSLVTAALLGPGLANAADTHFQGVASANPRTTGVSVPNILTRELIESVAAHGAMPLDGGNATFPFYGYSGDGPLLPAPNAQQVPGVK